MKKFLILICVALRFLSAGAQTVEKQTFLYSVKGSDSLRMDRYLVRESDRDTGPAPCMIFVFGGGFTSGQRDAAEYRSYFDYLARRGWQVFSIDYRLGLKDASSEDLASMERFAARLMRTLYMATEDLYTATAYVVDHAAQWGVDPARVVACGSSAGAITVLQGEYGLSNGAATAAQLLPAGFDYAGVISFAGAVFGMGDDLAWNRTPAPLMLFHGDADSNVPYDALRMGDVGFFGSRHIARRLAAEGWPYWFYSVENAAHELAVDPMNDNRYEIDAFLEKFVMQRQPLMIDTEVRGIGQPERRKDFTAEDYIRSNYVH